MKITIKESAQKQKEIKLENLEPGTIIGFGEDHPIGLVVDKINGKKEIVLLVYCDGSNWFEIMKGYKTYPIKKILGKITEIIVDPNI
jgi:hypothetical protein